MSETGDVRRESLRILGLVAAAVVVGLLVWLLVVRDGGDGEAGQAGEGPGIASEDDLRDLANEIGQAVYWAGPIAGTQLELTRTSDERIYVRYIGEDAAAGDPSPEFLTVGTYRFRNAGAAIEEAAEARGAIVEEGPDETTVVTNEQTPTSVYFASPNDRLQIEVYDPDPARALELALSGRVSPID